MSKLEVSVREMHEQGLIEAIEEHAKSDSETTGILRGGNTGIILADGTPVGSCPRLAALRMNGVTVQKTTPQDQIMFDGGLANEDYFFERVGRVWTKSGGTMVHESDTPSSWTTSSGIKVTGRPDGVLLCRDGVPIRGVELKGVFSLWRARDTLERKPVLKHLAQAAHYMCALGLEEYELVYVSRSIYAVNDMAAKLLPRYGAKWSEYLDYRFYKYRPWKNNPSKFTKSVITEEEYLANQRGKFIDAGRHGRVLEYVAEAGNVRPFCISFEMRAVGDEKRIEYKCTESGEDWTPSPVTWNNIREFFEVSASVATGGPLPPRPIELKADGTNKGYSGCRYCSLNEKCNTAKVIGDLIVDINLDS